MNMIGDCFISNDVKDGNPAGGCVTGVGISIVWQDGPLILHAADCARGDKCAEGCCRMPPNGAFVETVLEAVKQRLIFYQTAAGGRFECDENSSAIWHIEKALMHLDARTKQRQARGVEGSNRP